MPIIHATNYGKLYGILTGRRTVSADEKQFLQDTLNPKGKTFATVKENVADDPHRSTVIDYGVVEAVFPDDTSGTKHQLFNLRTEDGFLVKVAHNITLAPRVPDLKKGNPLGIKGDFIPRDELLRLPLPDDLEIGDVKKFLKDPAITGLLHWTHRPTSSNPKHENGGIVVFTPGSDYEKVCQ
ncbi:MAG: DUF3465 domain-containing protein [Armatimonadetes bacterium]|nr:DUF3465 domain-containing protein [Armatimonadota bacterium]